MRIFRAPACCSESINCTTGFDSPASCTEVSPTLKQFFSACWSAWIISSLEEAGIMDPTSPMALSIRIPLGSLLSASPFLLPLPVSGCDPGHLQGPRIGPGSMTIYPSQQDGGIRESAYPAWICRETPVPPSRSDPSPFR